MSHNYYSEIHLHIVWHTKLSQPLLSPDVETAAHTSVRARTLSEQGVLFHAIGGTENHVHVALAIPPTLLISEFIGRLKGGSSHEVNHVFGPGRLQWQNGYGVVSFGTRVLEWVKDYVRNQKQHHAVGRIYERLERVTQCDPPSP
ncbi:MAG TPA: IS200/IS605 family transposase [Gemmataceae bacterium]|nr:IS200/IS605 family transposase [Gemmataceae bacterium]